MSSLLVPQPHPKIKDPKDSDKKPNLLEEMRAMHKQVNAIVTAPRVAEKSDSAPTNATTDTTPNTDSQNGTGKKALNLVELNKQAEVHGQEAEFINALSIFLKKYEVDYLPAVRLPNGDILIRQTEGMVAINKRRERGRNLAAAMRTLMADETGPDLGNGWV